MVVNFSAVNLDEQPVLVLRNADGTAIQTLGYAHSLSMSLCYNEISTITFQLPAYVDGVKIPHYDDVIGMRIVDVVGWGQFILVNPSVEKTGIKEVKNCKAYSLEYELTYKKITLNEDTYNFWNPTTPGNTVLGIILDYLPSWSIGSVDSALIGKYRTFSEDNVNLYNFIKSTVQQTYNCIFDFDTYQRKIYVKSAASDSTTAPVYISLSNLAKEISVAEDTENIFTCLDVNGADGVDISNVNPLGTNKLYNLEYFMNTSHFSQEMIDKWGLWKDCFRTHQLEFFNLSTERALKTLAILTEEAALSTLTGGDLATLENLQAVYIEYLASQTDTASNEYSTYQNNLISVNAQIAAKRDEISAQESLISALRSEKDELTDRLVAIQNEVAFSSFFNNAEQLVLDRYFKEDSIQDSSFAVSKVESYSNSGESSTMANFTLMFSAGTVTKILGVNGKDLYTINGGILYCVENAAVLSADVVSASFERITSTGEIVMSAYLSNGTFNSSAFPSGCISMTGTCTNVTSDVVPDSQTPDSFAIGSILSYNISSARIYFTKNATEYERHSVEWSLFEYGQECVDKLSQPSFEFDVSVANFFALDEFISFATSLSFGQKIYLDLDDGNALQPIFIGAEINFEDLSSMSLSFGDKYNASDSAFKLVDLLDQSVSMGKTVDTNKMTYSAFVDSGASTAVKEFMASSLDTSKNSILSGGNMAISWDGSGIKCRKLISGGGYADEQIAIINNNICFTDDGWQSAKMAIGKFADSALGESWGIVAPNIVGTLIAGQNLVIESELQDGGVSVFKVDADGAVLHNAKFDIENGTSHIVLDPGLGFAIGDYPVIDTTGESDIWDETNAKFWVDTEGNVHIKGTLEGCTGLFSGELKVGGNTGFRVDSQGNLSIGGTEDNPNFYVSATGRVNAKVGEFSGTLSAPIITGVVDGTDDGAVIRGAALSVGGTNDNPNFYVDQNGNVRMAGSIDMSAGSISWGDNSPVQYRFSRYINGPWHYPMGESDRFRMDSTDGGESWGDPYQFVGSDADIPGYIWDTHIDSAKIISPEIYAGQFYATGQGRLGQPAYYIYDGCSISGANATLGDEVGYLSYDSDGAGNDDEASERVFLTTLGGIALKIQASGNMSLEASQFIYMGSQLRAYNGLCIGDTSYGDTLPAGGTTGQLFFLTS